MLKFLFLLGVLTVPTSPPPPDLGRTVIEGVTSFAVVGTEAVLFTRDDISVLPIGSLAIEHGQIVHCLGGETAGPHELVTTYQAANGTKTVRTNCHLLTDEECVKRHEAILKAWQKVAPPVKDEK